MLARIGCTLLLTSLIAGCGFWGGKDEIEPSPLVEFTPEKTVTVRWSVDVGEGPGDIFHQISPAVMGEQVFAMSVDGKVSAYQAQTGQVLWSVDLNTPLLGGVGTGDSKVVVTSVGGEVICLESSKGAELWRAALPSEASSPAQLNTDLVVLQLINGKIMALESRNGDVRWVYDSFMPRLTLRGTSTPLVALDVTLAGLDNGRFVALDNNNGGLLWEQSISVPQGRSELERMTDIDGSPLLFDNVVYVPSFQGQLVAINPFNAQTLWSKPLSSFHSLASGFGNIYVSEVNDHIQALDASSAASVWQQSALENRRITAPVAVNNLVAVGDKQGYIHFMSQIDGHFVARFDAGGGLTGDMKFNGNYLYVLNDKGRLFALTVE